MAARPEVGSTGPARPAGAAIVIEEFEAPRVLA
jgi:hypothetical protein